MKYEVYEGANEMKSQTVRSDEVFIVYLEPGESLYYYKGATPLYTAPENKRAVAIADRVRIVQGEYLIASQVRQTVECDFFSSYDYNGGYFWYPDPSLRKLCEQRGAERIKVSGGVRPLAPVTKILVPDFFESGTSWYVVPAKIVRDLRPVEFKAYCAA